LIWLRLAWRNVLANRRRSAMAMAAIAVATLVLVIFASYVNEIREGMKLSFIRAMGTGHLQISGKGGFGDFAELPLQNGLSPPSRAAIEKIADESPAVRRIAPRLQFGGMVSSGPRTLAFSGVGVDPVLERAAFGMASAVKIGAPLTKTAPDDGVVLGVELARQLGVGPGDFVTVMAPTVYGALNAMDMQVIGLKQSGAAQADLYYLQAKLQTAQKLLVTDKISTLAILLDDERNLDDALVRLQGATPNIEARTWLQLQPIYKQVMTLYETAFVLVGILLIATTMSGVSVLILTSVLERSSEIGLMRALGIAARQVRGAFLLEGVFVCLSGLVAGSILGAIILWLVNAANLTSPPPPGSTRGYPVQLLWDWPATAWIWAMVMALGVGVSWLTSAGIAKLKVVDALGARP
jgi:putative ABC transport system permease protein